MPSVQAIRRAFLPQQTSGFKPQLRRQAQIKLFFMETNLAPPPKTALPRSMAWLSPFQCHQAPFHPRRPVCGGEDRDGARLSSVVSPRQAFWSTASVWDGNLILRNINLWITNQSSVNCGDRHPT